MNRTRGHFFALALPLVLVLASCIPPSAPPTFKLGLVAPFSGREAALGYNMLFAAKLAVKEWNERGGVAGHYVELVAQDDRDEAEMGALQARKLALDLQVIGVIGHPAAVSARAAVPVYRQAGLPVLLVGPLLEEKELGGPPVFLLGPTAKELSQEVARFVFPAGRRPLIRLALIEEEASSGLAEDGPLVAALATAATALSGDVRPEVVFKAKLQRGTFGAGESREAAGRTDEGVGPIHDSPLPAAPLDQAALLQALVEVRPDLVYFDGRSVEGGTLLAGLRSKGLAPVFLGGPGLASPDFLKVAGQAAEGAYYVSPAPSPADVPAARAFIEAFRAAAGTDPWPQALTVYDGINVMLTALDRSVSAGERPGRQALRSGLAQGHHAGLVGPIAFDGRGSQVGAGAYIYRIEGMAWPGRLVGN